MTVVLVAGIFLVSGCTKRQPIFVTSDTPTPPSPAEEMPEAAESVNPRVAAALELTRQGERFLENGDPDAAIRVLERAVNLNPSSSENYYYLSEAWLVKENPEQAGEFNRLAEEYLEQNPAWTIPIARQRDRIEELGK